MGVVLALIWASFWVSFLGPRLRSRVGHRSAPCFGFLGFALGFALGDIWLADLAGWLHFGMGLLLILTYWVLRNISLQK